ncbi:hypothetical protein CO038_03855 [Candidatus Pacearchaeota archaeon CG_4_9_14_0_2_um_filter_39_13]|nr:hypothetical protein [Candidatus Pacearchaeota archaeon]OIO44054.1 MAG: hypothetical protein AUJ64_00880 [Candidatus Pacearchaeota archaeon CG1_02_39_14]PJC44411.1 MAG: hypothetical protein CO038_03855 [Candidatus Pacearchaeota archaeon CG_4_9_14_0_2_um_filter_39_13]
MIDKKVVYGIDFILIVGTLIGVFFAVGYVQPLVIGPIDGLETTNGSILFEFEKANLILIDDNPEFTSPEEIHAEDNLIVNLKPGVYYWKVEGALPGETRQLTIISEVSLKLKESSSGYSLVNSGNTRLNVDIYEDGKKTGDVILEVDEDREVKGTKFIGGQNE